MKLTRKGIKFNWGDVEQTVVDALKGALMKAPVLHLPDFSKTFEMHTNDSIKTLGAVLTQCDANRMPHSIAY